MDKCFVVDFEAAGDRQRTEALLDSPALRQKDEAFGEIRSFDNFYNPSACCLDRFDEAFLVGVPRASLKPCTLRGDAFRLTANR